MKKYLLAALALIAVPTSIQAQESPEQVEGLCGLSLAEQAVYEGTCIFETQPDQAGSKAIMVQMDNGLSVQFLRAGDDGQWTVVTTQGTIPVMIEPQGGAVTYQWQGASLNVQSSDGATTDTEQTTETEPSGGSSIPGTGMSVPTSTDAITDAATEAVTDKATDILLQQMFGF